MTERRVVPGRIYSPSTLRDRDDLLHSFATILGVTAPNDGDDGFSERVAELAREEEILPEGDRSLRNLIHQLGRLVTVFERRLPQFSRGLELLAPERNAEALGGQLLRIVSSAKAAIENRRLERLKSRPVDQGKLEMIRASIEAALLNEPSEAPFFRNVQVGRAAPGDDAAQRDIVFNNVPKAQFTEPPMETTSGRFEELFVTGSREAAGRHAWNSFCQRARSPIALEVRPEEKAFWGQIAPLLDQIGADAVLVLSQAEGRVVQRLMWKAPADRPELKIERRPQSGRWRDYIGTIEGVDVFSTGLQSGEAWVFSASALLRILYAKVDSPTRYVAVTFDPGEQVVGTLRVCIREKFEWSDAPIFEIRFQDQPKAESEA